MYWFDLRHLAQLSIFRYHAYLAITQLLSVCIWLLKCYHFNSKRANFWLLLTRYEFIKYVQSSLVINLKTCLNRWVCHDIIVVMIDVDRFAFESEKELGVLQLRVLTASSLN